jgi:hypothetical protein
VGLVRGGVRFGSTLLSGYLALYFAIASMLKVWRLPGFQYVGDFKAPAAEGSDRVPLTTQEAVNAFLGQFGPGQYLALVGGLIIMSMFVKAMFPKKKAPEPAPRRRR